MITRNMVTGNSGFIEDPGNCLEIVDLGFDRRSRIDQITEAHHHRRTLLLEKGRGLFALC